MAPALLHCCICPKQPNFSDSSHLLTHVSSKGHLSHLHKLQVRSHQEIPASQQLALYNQWFTEHNVAQLLSERMQQKERKQAKRRADNKRRCNIVKQELESNVDPSLLSEPKRMIEEISDHRSLGSTGGSSSTSTSAYRGTLHAENATLHDTCSDSIAAPLGSLWFPKIEPNDDLALLTIAQEDNGTPEAARLKGIIWPGMDMFDSADEETQRKRNQRKDVSVLQKMQAMSQLVEPLETVCSPGGTMKKRRHMDELEDDSPVEGETPVTKPLSKRKRKPLATLESNVSLPRGRRSRTIRSHVLDSSPTRKVGSNTTTPSRYSRSQRHAAQHDNDVPKLANTTSKSSRTKHGITIFDDEAPAFDHNTSYQPVLLPNPFINRQTYHARPVLSQPAAPGWPPSELQTSPYHDTFRDRQPHRTYADDQGSTALGKENINPLDWQHESKTMTSSPFHTVYGTFDDFDEALGPLAEVYAFIKNPLIGISPRTHDRYKTPQHTRTSKCKSTERATREFC